MPYQVFPVFYGAQSYIKICCCLIQKDWLICALSEEYLNTILLSWLIKCVHQILKKIYTEGKLNHCLKNTATLRSLIEARKMSVGVFPFIPQLSLSLCKGKVQTLFESFQCLRIQAARNDVRRLNDWICNLVVLFQH